PSPDGGQGAEGGRAQQGRPSREGAGSDRIRDHAHAGRHQGRRGEREVSARSARSNPRRRASTTRAAVLHSAAGGDGAASVSCQVAPRYSGPTNFTNAGAPAVVIHA